MAGGALCTRIGRGRDGVTDKRAPLAELPLDFGPETLAEAEELLVRLSSALFPQGLPDASRLTWHDKDRAAATDAGSESIEERLARAEARFRTLVEQIPAVTFMAVLGEGENEVYVSPTIEQMLGYSQTEWLSDPFLWYYRLHPDDRPLWNEEFARGCRSGGPFRAECRFLARDGRVVWVHGEARVIKDTEGRPQLLQGVAFDITESKEAQQVLLEHEVQRARVEEELAIARRLQTSLLPREPKVDGLELAAAMVPAELVGGDYYDVLPTDAGAWIAIGDVSGHGLNAGLIMMMAQSAVAAIRATNEDASPSEALAILNDLLFDNIGNRLERDEYVTMTLLHYRSDGQIVFSGAHQDMLVRRAATGDVERLPTPGTWLGLRREIRSINVDSTFSLEEGDLLVLYTDGITEAMNDHGEQFGMARLCDVIRDSSDDTPEAVRDLVLRAVDKWSRHRDDDTTIVVARRRNHGVS